MTGGSPWSSSPASGAESGLAPVTSPGPLVFLSRGTHLSICKLLSPEGSASPGVLFVLCLGTVPGLWELSLGAQLGEAAQSWLVSGSGVWLRAVGLPGNIEPLWQMRATKPRAPWGERQS